MTSQPVGQGTDEQPTPAAAPAGPVPSAAEPPLPGVVPAPVDRSLPLSGQWPAVAAGTAIWAVLLVLAWWRHAQLADDGHGWWVWTCLSGLVLGIIGLAYVRRHDAREARAARDAEDPPGTSHGPAGDHQG